MVNQWKASCRTCYLTVPQSIASMTGDDTLVKALSHYYAHDNFVMQRSECCGCAVTNVTIGA
jgi:hypothetical protein